MSLGKLRVINPGWCTERISYSRESNPRDAKAKGLERKSSKTPKKQLVVIKTRVKETKRTSDTRRIKVRSHVGISMLSCVISFGVSFPQFTSTKSFNQSPAKWHWREMFPRPWGGRATASPAGKNTGLLAGWYRSVPLRGCTEYTLRDTSSQLRTDEETHVVCAHAPHLASPFRDGPILDLRVAF